MSYIRGRVARRFAAVASAVALVGFVAAVPAVAASDPPGPIGNATAVASKQDFPLNHPYDVAVTASGTAYVGWIGATEQANGQQTRTVNLCTLAPSSTTCTGGVQSISAGDPSSASSLHLVATPSGVELLWSYDTTDATIITEADALNGQNLMDEPGDDRTVPLGSQLLDAVFDSTGQLWTLSDRSAAAKSLTVFDGLVPQTVKSPVPVYSGQLAFDGKTGVLVVTKYGSASSPVRYSTDEAGGEFLTFRKVAGTWANGDAALVGAGKGVRLVTGVNNASYRPVIVPFSGNSFGSPRLTSDHNTSAGERAHDAATDPSGRVADVGWESNDLTVTAYPDDKHAAVSRLKVKGTTTFAPQIGESTRGIATVIWSREHGVTGSDLFVSRFRLGDVSKTASDSSKGGRAVLTGPVNCLPVSNTPVKLAAHPAKGWKVRSHEIDLDGKKVDKSHLDGASLASGTSYTLSGKVVFGKHGSRSTATPSITFRTC